MELRFIMRDGKRILQQRDCDSWESPKPWKDVPLVEEKEDE